MAYTPSCMHMALLQALSILFLASMPMLVAGSAEEAPSVYRFELIHVDANGSFTREELIRRAVNRTRLRAAMLSAEDDTNSPAFSGTYSIPTKYSYLMELKMGTLPETTSFLAVADTGSEVIWTKQMKMCTGSPSFTFTHGSCSDSCPDADGQCNCKSCPVGATCGTSCMFNRTYGGGETKIRGLMGTENLILPIDKKVKVSIALGCAIDWSDDMLPKSAEGIVGLNRGPMSLVNQLGVTKFSYCLSNPLKPELSSPLWFGDVDLGLEPASEEGWQSTPLATKNSPSPVEANRYFVELDQICLKDKGKDNCKLLEKENFKFKSQDKGLMFVDSGTTYTHLDTNNFEVFTGLIEEVLKVKLFTTPDQKLTCFTPPAPSPSPSPSQPPAPSPAPSPGQQPDMVLKFTGADMRLRWANYMVKQGENFCLTIEKSDKSILGNIQQQNIYMLYDLTEKHNERLSFVRVQDCSKEKL